MKELLLIILIALGLRLLAFEYLPQFVGGIDSVEYYHNSIDLTAHPIASQKFGYTNWYERTPIYVYFLHLVNRDLLFQILLSVIGVVLMWHINKLAGWFWCFFIPDIVLSSVYLKESLVLFSIILLMYSFRKYYKFAPLIVFLFASFSSGVSKYNWEKFTDKGILSFVEMWNPKFPFVTQSNEILGIICISLFLLMTGVMGWYMLGNKMWSEISVLIIYTILFGLAADIKWKLYLMPMLIYWFGSWLQYEYNQYCKFCDELDAEREALRMGL